MHLHLSIVTRVWLHRKITECAMQSGVRMLMLKTWALKRGNCWSGSRSADYHLLQNDPLPWSPGSPIMSASIACGGCFASEAQTILLVCAGRVWQIRKGGTSSCRAGIRGAHRSCHTRAWKRTKPSSQWIDCLCSFQTPAAQPCGPVWPCST